MARKKDIRQIEAIAREFNMNAQQRRDFGDYVEECKQEGERGSGERGDFTYEELRFKAREFMGEAE